MPEWIIRTNTSANPERITADYFKVNSDGPFSFVEFKDADHKVVYMVSAQHILSVKRDDAPRERKMNPELTIHYPMDGTTPRAVGMAAEKLGGYA